MMNDKSRYVLRIVASLYIAYVGIQLLSGVIKDKPENFALLAAAGIFFVLAGAAILLNSIKSMSKIGKETCEAANVTSDETTVEDEDTEVEENERIEIKRATVADLKAQTRASETTEEQKKTETEAEQK